MIKKKIIYGCEERGDGSSPYLIRYTLFETKSFQICIHVFLRSDHIDLHDHPWPFISLILWNGYYEETAKGYFNKTIKYKSRKWPLMLLFRKATHRHRVELIKGRKAVTLVMMGKRKREWGFFTKDGWIMWRRYFIQKKC